jgi:antitoxin component of MazEF toxin-antitoxin module
MAEKTYKILESKRQLKVTLPIVLAQSIGLNKGDEITWIIEHGDLIIRKVKR